MKATSVVRRDEESRLLPELLKVIGYGPPGDRAMAPGYCRRSRATGARAVEITPAGLATTSAV